MFGWVYTDLRNLKGWRKAWDIFFFYFSFCVIKSYVRVWCRLSLEGGENIPREGAAILVSNHLNFIDGLVVLAISPRKVSFMIAREYYESRLFGWYCRFLDCIPVNRTGEEIGSVKKALRALSKGALLGVFPEGAIKQTEPMQEAKEGIAFLAMRSGAPVVPVRLSGYGYQSMVGSVLLPKKVRARVGKPMRFGGENYKDRESLERVTRKIAEAVRELGEDKD